MRVGSSGGRRWVRWLVAGRVQGVGFRWFVQQAASRCGVEGDVRNLADGRVEIRARGSAAQLDNLLSEVRRGPGYARVDRVENADPQPVARVDGFGVRY